MALKMALFQPRQRQDEAPATRAGTKAAPRTGTRARGKADTEAAPEPGALARARARLTGRATTAPATDSAAATKAAPKNGTRARTGARTKAGTTPKTVTRPGRRNAPRTRSTPGSRTGAPERAPRTPLLQRDALGPALARGAVLAIALVCMVGFAVALAKVTLVPSPASDSLVHTNLRPGASIRAYLDQPALRDSVKQIGGNILLGVPFGVLVPMLFPRFRGLLRVAVITALVMVLVESAQGAIVEGRAFDIDDVILNTSGALIGYLMLGRRLGRALHPRRHHWWHRFTVRPDRQPARTRQ